MGGGLINFHCKASDRQTYSSPLITKKKNFFTKMFFFFITKLFQKFEFRKKNGLRLSVTKCSFKYFFFLQCSVPR